MVNFFLCLIPLRVNIKSKTNTNLLTCKKHTICKTGKVLQLQVNDAGHMNTAFTNRDIIRRIRFIINYHIRKCKWHISVYSMISVRFIMWSSITLVLMCHAALVDGGNHADATDSHLAGLFLNAQCSILPPCSIFAPTSPIFIVYV